jgi:hypothetical protein
LSENKQETRALLFAYLAGTNIKERTVNYNHGLDILRHLAEGTDWHLDFAVQEARLSENLTAQGRYGDTPTLRAERSRCIEQLNELALGHLGVSFNDLCLGKVPAFSVPIKVTESSSSAIKILFLAANPSGTTRLRLDKEIREIDQALRQAEFRDRFDIKQHWAVRVADLQGLLLRHKPDIVHFCGHGSASSGLVLEDASGKRHPVSARAMSQLFSILKDNIKCVVLNACYSEPQAQAIAEHIDCVIGMSEAIGDAAAISFAVAFYQALGFGRDVRTAFDLGCVQIDLENLDEQDTPKLLAKTSDPKDFVQAH